MSVGAGQTQTPMGIDLGGGRTPEWDTTRYKAPYMPTVTGPGFTPYMPNVTTTNPVAPPGSYAPFQSSYYGSPQEQMYGSPMTPQQPYAGYYQNYRLPGPTYGAGSGGGGKGGTTRRSGPPVTTPTEMNTYSDVAKNQANPQGDYGPSRDVQTGKVTFGRTADGQNIYIDPNTGSAVNPTDPNYGQYSVDASGNQTYTPNATMQGMYPDGSPIGTSPIMYNQGPDSLGGAFIDPLFDPIFNPPAPVVPPLAQQQQEIDDFRRREREF